MSNYNLNDQNVDSWSEHNVEYQSHTPKKSNAISLMMAGQDEMLKITEHGFYVRGKKVPQDDREAAVVYNAFKQWLAWANLQR